MTPILLTGPAIEPISVEETKIFLRVEHDDEDQLIAALIAGARSHIEVQTHTALITQNWRMVLDAWPQHRRITVTRSKPKSGATERLQLSKQDNVYRSLSGASCCRARCDADGFGGRGRHVKRISWSLRGPYLGPWPLTQKIEKQPHAK